MLSAAEARERLENYTYPNVKNFLEKVVEPRICQAIAHQKHSIDITHGLHKDERTIVKDRLLALNYSASFNGNYLYISW